MPDSQTAIRAFSGFKKFQDPLLTAKGEERAVVALTHLRTLWFNTGSLCNITCVNCYMESSPVNDDLVYLSLEDVRRYLAEAGCQSYALEEVAFTGGEPFMNKHLPAMLAEALGQGYRALVLTNAMKPLHHKKEQLLDLKRRYGDALSLRVSLDHFTPEHHECIRGADTWAPTMHGLRWLAENGFNLAIAGRTCWDETDEQARAGYGGLFASEGIPVDAGDPSRLVLFPEMDVSVDVPEISVNCWDILGVKPESIMCATSRMVVRKKGADSPTVVPCTLLPYDPAFELGADLASSANAVRLNHPHCAKFCVLGGASCSPD
jgi:uncharacterized Fe-S cluster-containing radical SAM superfamily protein